VTRNDAMRPIVTFNAGSSSLKFAAFDLSLAAIFRSQVDGSGTEAVGAALGRLKEAGIDVSTCSGVGHRIVHGGTRYRKPVPVDDQVQHDLEALRKLAPLHLPFGLGALRTLREIAPRVPHVACFDTAFHASRSDLSKRFPLPREFHERGYQRYGFHGLNYEHIVRALPEQTGKPLPRRLLAAHLGNGSSLCAILDGRSIETTMSFSTADGLVMGTRTGSIDPGVLIALMRDDGFTVDELESLLYRRSGLLGLSGFSSDMRELLASAKAEAKEAVAHYCHQAARHAASLAVSMGGLDAIVFSGGIGENAAEVRDAIVRQLRFLDVKDVHIAKADEELTIARHTLGLIDE
jgi:acetate kinase